MRYILILLLLAVCGCKSQNDIESRLVNEGDYPERPVEIIIPFGEGGASDIFVRDFSRLMQKDFHYGITFANISGQGGQYAMQKAQRSPADGYTILEITPSIIIHDILENGGKKKLMQDFVPIAKIQSDNYIVSFSKDSQYRSFEDMMKAKKGKVVLVSGISKGGLDSIAVSLLAESTGVDFRLVPYKSGAEAKAGIVSGETSVYIDKVISALPMINKELVKPVLVLGDERLRMLKDVPCSGELGLNTPITSWRAFMVRRETPKYIRRYINESVRKVMQSEEYQMMLSGNDDGITDTIYAERFINGQYEVYKSVVKGKKFRK